MTRQQGRASRKSRYSIRDSDMPGLMSGPTRRAHKPRGAWDQGTWSSTSPYWRSMVSIDRRWDK